MADFNKPVLTSLYADMLTELKASIQESVIMLDGSTNTNIPTNAKRWNATNNYFENFNGTSWVALTTKYMIDVDKIDGCTVNDLGTSTTDLWTASKVTNALSAKLDSSAYTAADVLTKIKTVDGASSGLDADLLDGLHATSANTVSTVVARDASGNFSAGTITANLTGTASTATTLTGLTSTIAELNYMDGVTSNVQTQLNGKLSTTGTAADSAKLNGVASAETATASTIVKRNASGHIYANAFNSSISDTTTGATHYYVETGSDGWLRPKTLANVKAELLASAALTGIPTAPTAAVGTNTTQIATTAFVLANSDTVTATTVGAATAGIAVGGLGGYAFLSKMTSGGSIAEGETLSGASLRYAGGNIAGTSAYYVVCGGQSASGLSGTWKAMGYCEAYAANWYPSTLWLRIA